MNRFAVLGLTALLSSASYAVIDNASFESWQSNNPVAWTTIDSGIDVNPSNVAYEGATSAAITVNTGSQSSTDFRQTIAVQAGQTYDFSVWLRHTEGGMRARLYVDGYQGYSNASQTNQWQQVSHSYTANSSGDIEIGLRFYDVSGFDGSETVYVDGFQPAVNNGGNTGGGDGNTTACATVEFNLTTDNYGNETSWNISQNGSAVMQGSGYSNNQSYSDSACLEAGNYELTVNDSYGDGICCSQGNGSYAVTVDGTAVVEGGNFNSTISHSFAVTVDNGNTGGTGGDTGGDTGGNTGSCTDGNLALTTDQYGSETSWQISQDGTVVAEGNGYGNNQSYNESICLNDGSYTFTIVDSYGDGICCSYGQGSYRLTIGGNDVATGGSFGSQESTNFTVGNNGGGTTGGGNTGGDVNQAEYYSAANGLTGYALKSALYNIINGHNVRGYGALWDFYNSHSRDVYYENDNSILDIYSENPNGTDPYTYAGTNRQCGSYSGEGDCYNREHSFPRSWFGGSVEPMNSDVHHIFATDGKVNSVRSSYPFGNVASASYTSQNGSLLGSFSGSGFNGTVFEPVDEFKGDIARAHFYMATRYENVIANWENNSGNSNDALNGTNTSVFEPWLLAVLKQWHTADPVSQLEIDRNNAAFNYQGNRNPFIDNPQWVSDIWGN